MPSARLRSMLRSGCGAQRMPARQKSRPTSRKRSATSDQFALASHSTAAPLRDRFAAPRTKSRPALTWTRRLSFACRVGPVELGLNLDYFHAGGSGTFTAGGLQLKWARELLPAGREGA